MILVLEYCKYLTLSGFIFSFFGFRALLSDEFYEVCFNCLSRELWVLLNLYLDY